MTAYVITAACNIDQLGTLSPSGSASARAGGDTIDTNGFNFTIDQDTRGGLTGGAGLSFGNMTVNATKGGNINIDATAVRWIAYTGGSGNVPAWNTLITQSGQSGSGKLIGVYASLTSASTATGAAMPATGFIKVKQTTGTYAAGALTGITATSSGADVAGWIEVVGDEAGTINANRLGQVNITGAFFQIGTTSGTSNQTMQAPTGGMLRYLAGVFVETEVASGLYEFWPNNGVNTTTGTEATRGKVVWIDNAGLVRIGNSGAATNGYTPVSGLRVMIPNIFLENCTTAARTANVIPNATIATRYDFTCTGGGVVSASKANFAWYPSFSQAYSVSLTDVGIVDGLLLSEIAAPMTMARVGVGNKPTTALLMSPLTMSLCFAGGTFTDCVWQRATMAASGAHTNTLTDIAGFDFIRDTIRAGVIRGNATTYSINGTRVNNCTWTGPTIIQGAATFTTCNGITFTGTKYAESVSATTVTTYAGSVWTVASNSLNCKFDGLTLPVTNNQPYTALLQINAAGCDTIKLRNIGTRASPQTLGSVNACGLIYALAGGAAASNVKIQRVYCSNTRTGIMTGDNSSTKITDENVFGDYADAADVGAVLNYKRKGTGGTLALTAQTAIYGTHFADYFTSTTAGRIAILMNEATTLTASQVTLANGAAFTSAGGLYMPTIGMAATFETPEYIIGHTAFQNSAAVMAGGTVGNYRFEYSIDKNDGNGFSAMTASAYTAALLATALNGLTGIDAALGFKLRLKISTTTGNTTAITSVYLLTSSTTTAQDYQYPLDTNTVTFTGLPTGCDAVVLTAGTSTILEQKDAMAGTSYAYTFSGAQTVDVGFIKPGFVPYYIRNLALTAVDSSIPVSLTADRNYQ